MPDGEKGKDAGNKGRTEERGKGDIVGMKERMNRQHPEAHFPDLPPRSRLMRESASSSFLRDDLLSRRDFVGTLNNSAIFLSYSFA